VCCASWQNLSSSLKGDAEWWWWWCGGGPIV
jgi:hypothetical protein